MIDEGGKALLFLSWHKTKFNSNEKYQGLKQNIDD